MPFSKEVENREYIEHLLESVSIDHDGVVADSRQAVTDEFNDRYGTKHDVTEVSYWNVVVDWCLKLGMDEREAKAINYELWYTPDTLFKAKPISGAIEFLHELYMRDKNFVINSSRIPELHESTVAWYVIHAPFVDPDRIRTHDTKMKDGLASKIYRVQNDKRRIHIEDVPEQALMIYKHTSAHVILLSNARLGNIKSARFTQIRGEDGQMPDFWAINKMFFD